MVGEAPLAVIAPALDEDTATVTKVFALSNWEYYGATFSFESITVDCPGGWLVENEKTATITADGVYRQSKGEVVMAVGSDTKCLSNNVKASFNGVTNGVGGGDGCSINIPTVDIDGTMYLQAGEYEAKPTANDLTSIGIIEHDSQSIVPKVDSLSASTSSWQLTGTLTDKGIKILFTYTIKRIH